MKIKFICNKIEVILKEKFPDSRLKEVYYSRRRKHIHFAFDEKPFNFERKDEFQKEVERIFETYLKSDFELINPMKIIHTIKWKFDYIVFRKRKGCS